MTSRQTEHNRRTSLERLQKMIPHDCPLCVRREGHVFVVIDEPKTFAGRFQLVATWIDGYLTAWKART